MGVFLVICSCKCCITVSLTLDYEKLDFFKNTIKEKLNKTVYIKESFSMINGPLIYVQIKNIPCKMTAM